MTENNKYFNGLQGGQSGSRYYGGTTNDHAYVKGYYQVFMMFPTAIFGANAAEAQKIFLTSTIDHTPVGNRTINTAEVAGQGGLKSNVVTGQTLAQDFSLTMQEKWKTPCENVINQWLDAMIDPFTGVSRVLSDFHNSEYKGQCWVINTKPVAVGANVGARPSPTSDDITKVYVYDGVLPTADNLSGFGASNTDNSLATGQYQFKFDGAPGREIDPGILEGAQSLLQSIDYSTTIDIYNNVFASGTTGAVNAAISPVG
jgi:hypothetical protein